MLLEQRKMGLASGITMLSYIRAERYVSIIVLPVCAENLWFDSHNGDGNHKSQLVAGPRKCWDSRWNLVAIMCTSWDMRYCICTSGISPSELSDLGNTGIAVGISLLSCAQAELTLFEVYRPPSWNLYFRFLPVRSYNIVTTSFGLLDLENIGIAVGVSLLSCAQAELYVFKVHRPPSWFSTFGCIWQFH